MPDPSAGPDDTPRGDPRRHLPLTAGQRQLVTDYLAKWDVLAVARTVHRRHYLALVGAGVADDDIGQECLARVCAAARRFDPARASFATYAGWAVMGAMSRLLHRAGVARRLPTVRADTGHLYYGDGDDGKQGERWLSWADIADGRVAEPVEPDPRLAAAVAKLSPPLRFVVEARYGLGDDPPRTLAEIGEAVGLSKERVRQIQAQAVRRLRFLLGVRTG